MILTQAQETQINELRAQGLGYKLIGKTLKMSPDIVRGYLKRHGMLKEWTTPQKDEEKAMEVLDAAGFDYVSGDKWTKGHVIVRDRRCGHEYEMSMKSIVNRVRGYDHFAKEFRCPVCVKLERQEQAEKRKEQQRLEQQAERAKRIKAKEINALQNAVQISMVECPECGMLFIKNKASKKYCSEQCAHRHMNSLKEHKRRMREQEQMVDKNISLRRLYERDNGKCYICGCQCDWNDHQIVDGVFIVGDSYPTIEHVIPLCCGGAHAWSNVKLACFRCNSIKGRQTI